MCVPRWREPAPVITGRTEENQEGTLCGFDKQAQGLSKHCSGGLRPRWLCPPTGPRAAPYYLSSLTSDYMSGQLCQNKRRAGGNVAGILTDCRKRQPPLEEKPATFHKQVPTCGPPGAGCSAARSLRRVIYPEAACLERSLAR